MTVSLASVANTQLSGLTGRKIRTPYNQALVSQLPSFRDAAAAATALKQNKEQFDQNMALQQEIAGASQDQANKASLISLGNLGLSLTSTKDTWMPAIKGAGSKAMSLGTAAKDYLMNKITGSAGKVAADAATDVTVNAAGQYVAPYAADAETVAPATAETSTGSSTGLGTAGSVLAYIGAAELARGFWGGKGIPWDEKTTSQRIIDSPVTAGMEASLVPGALFADEDTFLGKSFKEMARMERGAMAPIDALFGDPEAKQYLNPFGDSTIGEVANWVFNPVGAIVDSVCIIVTACTGRNSPEVEITRKYRDRFMPPDQLRGYYMIAEKVVPLMLKNAGFKNFIKKYLVDNIIKFCRKEIGESDSAGIVPTLVTKSFLGMCTLTGMTRKSYMRSNGEVF